MKSAPKSLRIAIVTSGRFHVLDLARELDRLGHQVQLLSAVPPWETRRFGLLARNNRWLGPHTAGVVWASRRLSGRRAVLLNKAATELIDRTAALRIGSPDVVIAMSGVSLRVLEKARERGALVVVERGSQHIRAQIAILQRTAALKGQTYPPVERRALERELRGYALADVVSIPSSAVEASFVEQGFDTTKLERNPYGTSLEIFTARPVPPKPRRILMTGSWSLRKGCDILFEAFLQMPADVELWHVGSVVDLPLPQHTRFRHFDAVPQASLPDFYAQCHVFALASREEGMAVVQMQAVACGLALVCTLATGGADLETLVPGSRVFVSEVDRVDDFSAKLRTALESVGPEGEDRQPGDTSQLSWRAYAERYSAMLLRRLATR